jgi:hypothetical protein
MHSFTWTGTEEVGMMGTADVCELGTKDICTLGLEMSYEQFEAAEIYEMGGDHKRECGVAE